jgi:flagellar biosynthetic protein FliP
MFGLNVAKAAGGESLTTPLQIILLLTALTVLPAILMAATPFLRITLVLHFLRQALGTQTAPSNQILIGMALFLTTLLMQPVGAQMYDRGWAPYEQGKLKGAEAWEQGTQPLKTFLLKFAREKDIALLVEATKSARPRTASDLDLRILMPAYVLSELRAGFQIGAVLFLPFLIIDLIVASVTLSIGMVQLPPVMISAPLKLMLFVLVDGWNLVVGSLLRSFA